MAFFLLKHHNERLAYLLLYAALASWCFTNWKKQKNKNHYIFLFFQIVNEKKDTIL